MTLSRKEKHIKTICELFRTCKSISWKLQISQIFTRETIFWPWHHAILAVAWSPFLGNKHLSSTHQYSPPENTVVGHNESSTSYEAFMGSVARVYSMPQMISTLISVNILHNFQVGCHPGSCRTASWSNCAAPVAQPCSVEKLDAAIILYM